MKNILKATKLLWQTSKLSLIFLLILYGILAFIPPLKLLLTNMIINMVSEAMGGNNSGMKEILFLILIQFFISGIVFFFSHLQTLINSRMEYQLEYHIEKNIMIKTRFIPLEVYEETEFYNHFNRVVQSGNIASNLITPVIGMISITSTVISLFTVIGMLFKIHYLLVLLSLGSFIPYVYYNSRFGKEIFSLMKFQTPLFRKISYCRSLVHTKQSLKEIRLFNLYDYIINKWDRMFLINMKERLNLLKKQEMLKVCLDLVRILFYSIASVILIKLILKQKAKIGDFVMSLQAIEQVQAQSAALAGEIANVYSNLYYLDDYFEFIELIDTHTEESNEVRKTTITQVKKIEFINASFTYPGSSKKILKNINLTIREGEKISIVGENGSGKTTLIYCLIGLFKLKDGELKINGISISDIEIENYREQFTVIFQDFMRYAFSIKENIALNESNLTLTNQLEKAIYQSGSNKFIDTFSNGVETMLGKIYDDGEDLSGGQWQKVAIARSIYRNSEIMILDEPTAALDPKSETYIFQQYEKLTRGRIAIYISHRLAYTKNVDRIIVLKDGEIVEEGNHEKLMSDKKLYYEMYSTQSKVYIEEKEKEKAPII